MAALTTDRNTPARSGDRRSFPVKAATKIFAGSLVCIDSSGLAVPGATATTLVAVGRAPEQVDNSAGADGDLRIEVERGIFRFGNSAAADEIAVTDIGASVYVVDDQTVAKTSATATRSVAGTVFDVDALGVWIQFA